MKIGICLPYMKKDFGRKQLLEWCHRIDAGPFSSISCGERITGYSLEMRAMLAAAAAVTERVQIIPSLYVLPMHNAIWAAKEIATLDVISGGRVTVTVGVGGREKDYQTVGASFANRHQRLDDQIVEMRRIWAGEVPFEGADEVGPDPIQAGGPQILAGAMGPKAIARAAHWAQGLYAFSLNGEKHEIAKMFAMADEAWRTAGRAEPPKRVAGFWYSLADDAEARLKDYVFHYMRNLGDDLAKLIAGSMTRHTPDAILESMRAMQALGCEELFMVPATGDIAEVDRLAAIAGEFI